MAMNRALIGKEYGPVEGEVIPREAIYYALATNDPNPWYINGARPGGTVAPPLYAISKDLGARALILIIQDTELALNYAYVVHGEQYFEWHKPLIPGAKMKVTARIQDIIDKGTGDLLEMKVDCIDEKGELAVSQIVSFFERRPDAPKKPKSEAQPEDRSKHLFDAPMKVLLGQTYIYAEPSGDHNPIHVNPEFAVQVGLSGIILQGLCTMAFVQKAVIDNVAGGDPTKLKKLKVRFSRNVLPGDTVTTTGWLKQDKGTSIVAGLEAKVDRGDVVIRDAWAEVAK
jgi:acyl dehydratase